MDLKLTTETRCCPCCDGQGWHESECGARAFCRRCAETGRIEVIPKVESEEAERAVRAQLEAK